MAQTIDSTSAVQAHRLELSRLYAECGCCDARGRALHILDDYLAYLEVEMTPGADAIDVGQIQEMLLEVSCLIRSNGDNIESGQYNCILNRLVGLFGRGLAGEARDVFAAIAADYAEVLEAIATHHSHYDYGEAIGQLLVYMNHLYESRKGSWSLVYEHLQSMPESIHAVQMLKEQHFREIQRWAEEGVHNLFAIARDYAHTLAELDEKILELEARIAAREGQDGVEQIPHQDSNVVSLAGRRRAREVQHLRAELDRLLEERAGKEQVAALIDANIREFEAKLKEARRTYHMRLVYSDEPERRIA